MTSSATPPAFDLEFRAATVDDATALALLVRTAYRGEVGWTTESALLDDQRIDAAGVAAKIADPRTTVLVAHSTPATAPNGILACCELVDKTDTADGLAYFGMFAVDPALQAAGVGRRVLAYAESYATQQLHARTMEMTVIGQREELIAYYLRRGYLLTDETRPFPFHEMVGGGALRDDLYFAVLRKDIASAHDSGQA